MDLKGADGLSFNAKLRETDNGKTTITFSSDNLSTPSMSWICEYEGLYNCCGAHCWLA